MNNLTPYESYLLNESVDNGPMGFVISLTMGNRELAMSYTVAGIYDTFYDFAHEVSKDFVYDEDGDEPTVYKDFAELIDHIFDATETRGDHQFWHGFKVKPGASGYHSESNLNCYNVGEMLEKLFVRPKDIMMGKDSDKRFDLSYLARSVEKDVDKLLIYEDDPDMYKKIISLLNWDKKKLDAVLRVNRIKNQF
jgi:hypothetical protein